MDGYIGLKTGPGSENGVRSRKRKRVRSAVMGPDLVLVLDPVLLDLEPAYSYPIFAVSEVRLFLKAPLALPISLPSESVSTDSAM